MKKVIVKSEKETEALANDIAQSLIGGEIIALSGELGAGKTTFTQYLAKALGVKRHVNSPTFVLMKVYEAEKGPIRNLVHLDAYRIDSEREIEGLGLDNYLNNPQAVIVIEWAERLPEFLSTINKLIKIEIELKGEERSFTILVNQQL